MMRFSPSFLGGPGTACFPGKFLETGMLEKAFPGILMKLRHLRNELSTS